MADDSRLQVNVDFSKYPELYNALLILETELDTDKSKLIRNLIREKVQEHGHLKRVYTNKIKPKIKEITR